jgi:alpha-tubulin suppressor-like RCC1 family protein
MGNTNSGGRGGTAASTGGSGGSAGATSTGGTGAGTLGGGTGGNTAGMAGEGSGGTSGTSGGSGGSAGASGAGSAGQGGSAGKGVIPPDDTPVFAAIDLGSRHSCGLLTDGSVYCWGDNTDGMLGDGTAVEQRTPVKVLDLSGVTAISAGGAKTCAVMDDRSVRCWSSNPGGSLGTGVIGPAATPTEIEGLEDVANLSVSATHACAVLGDATVRCWGANLWGQLGNEDAGDASDTPVVVTGLTDVAQVETGSGHTCARLTSGEVRCWGNNADHQISTSDIASSVSPLTVPEVPPAYAIAAGGSHNCAIVEPPESFYGTILCWGANWSEQLGSTSTLTYTEPSPHLRGAIIAAGHGHSCALSTQESFWCWGTNGAGQIGVGHVMSPASGSVEGVHMPPVVQIALGTDHSCALQQDGTARCWGDNSYGQLGTGTIFDYTEPTRVRLFVE